MGRCLTAALKGLAGPCHQRPDLPHGNTLAGAKASRNCHSTPKGFGISALIDACVGHPGKTGPPNGNPAGLPRESARLVQLLGTNAHGLSRGGQGNLSRNLFLARGNSWRGNKNWPTMAIFPSWSKASACRSFEASGPTAEATQAPSNAQAPSIP